MIILTWAGHTAVIKGEQAFGVGLWPVFLVIGVASLVISFITANVYISVILGVTAAVFLWSIYELFKQRERVKQKRVSRGRARN